jgi:hypothetical protein
MFLPTVASYQFMRRFLEVLSLNDSAVGSGQSTEIKTKNIGNIGLYIEIDLMEFDKDNSSRRISEGLRARPLKQKSQRPENIQRKSFKFNLQL